MPTLRFQALKETLRRNALKIEEKERRSVLFGENIFNQTTMLQYLIKDAFRSVMDAVEKGVKIDRKIADQIAPP